jgi:hypothetical protein
MRVAIEDLGLHHLWVVTPGPHRYPIDDSLSVVPLTRLKDEVGMMRDE